MERPWLILSLSVDVFDHHAKMRRMCKQWSVHGLGWFSPYQLMALLAVNKVLHFLCWQCLPTQKHNTLLTSVFALNGDSPSQRYLACVLKHVFDHHAKMRRMCKQCVQNCTGFVHSSSQRMDDISCVGRPTTVSKHTKRLYQRDPN